MQQDRTIYYDGACPLCGAEIGLSRSRARAERISFVDLTAIDDQGAQGLGLDLACAKARFHVRDAIDTDIFHLCGVLMTPSRFQTVLLGYDG